MIAPNSVSYAVYLLCASDALLNTSGGLLAQAPAVRVGWHGPLPKDPTLCPWIQVHVNGHGMTPHRMGAGGAGWENTYQVQVFAQTASWLAQSGAAFRDAWDLEHYMVHSMFSISSNFSLPLLTANAPGTTLALMGMETELWDVDVAQEATLVTTLLTLTYQGRG